MSNTLKMLVIPDVHAPYHHIHAYRCLLDVARRWRPDVAVCLGDFADFAAVSSHPKDPRRLMPFVDEVGAVNDALDELDLALKQGGCRTKDFLQGNHETRLDRYMMKQAPDVREFVDWADLLKLDRRNWRVTPYMKAIGYGHLQLSHEFGRFGANAARSVMVDLGHSGAFGHTHRLCVEYKGQLDGSRHVGATLGWLGDPAAIDYRHANAVRRDSIHAIGVIHFRADGTFWLQAVPIIKGRCVVDGEVYSA